MPPHDHHDSQPRRGARPGQRRPSRDASSMTGFRGRIGRAVAPDSMLRMPQVPRFGVLFFLLGIFQASLGPLIPVVAARNGLSPATAGLVISAFFAGSLTSMLLASAASERRLDHRVLTLLTVLIAVGDLGLVLLPTWPGKLAAVGVAGLGFGALTLIVNAEMASRPQHGVALVNLVNATFGVGAALGPALVAISLHQRYPPALILLAVAILATAPVRATSLAHPSSAPEPERAHQPVQRASLRQLVGFCLLLACYPALETGLSSWETTYLHSLGHTAETAALLTSLFWVGLATSRFAIPVFAARWSASSIILISLAMTLAALGLISLAPLAAVGFLLAGIASGPIKPSALAWIAASTTRPRRMNGLAMASAMLGNIAIPAGLGYAMTATHRLALPALVALATAICLTITLILRATLTRRALREVPDAPV